MEQALRARLVNDGTVAGIVGDKVFWRLRPQGSDYPCVVLSIVSDDRAQDYAGRVGLWQTRVQIDCYALKYGQNVALRDAVIAAILPGAALSGVTFSRAFIDTVRDLGADTDAGFVHRTSIDALIWHG